MSAKTPYSRDFTPPAPVLGVRVSPPSGAAGVALAALVDTGADVSVLPQSIVEALGLPATSNTRIQGVTGVPQSVRVHAARFEIGGKTKLAEVASLGEEAILGRDLLNGFVIKLDGPRATLELAMPPSTGTSGRRLRRVRPP